MTSKSQLHVIILFWISSFALQAQAQDYISPSLFAEEEILPVVIETDLRELFRDDGEERDYHKVRFIVHPSKVDSQEIPVRVMVRGNFRRQECRLPPLKLNFKDEDVADTYMEGIDKIKMVLPCRWGSSAYEEYILKEYLVYRMYNQLTDSSFKVRLLKVTFRDSAEKLDTFTQYGFFIEPLDNLEDRLEGYETEQKGVHPNATDTKLATLMSVYHYMIGNTDWSIPGLHNVKLVKTDSFTLPLTIPYDFDWCGVISAPYATPAPKLGIKTVRERIFRGFCRPEEEMNQVLDHFEARKDNIYAEVNAFSYLDEKEKKRLLNYLEEFYEVIEDNRRRKYVFMETCRQ